jgi:hypothetical protein
MGVGKTATCRELQKLLPNCVFLDGDWCWDASPFIVNDETKAMAIKNITGLLNNFLSCSAYDNVLFCWVMHEDSIVNSILSEINMTSYDLHQFSLVCTETALRTRLTKDIAAGVRKEDILARSISRLPNYKKMSTTKIDVSSITAAQAANEIYLLLYGAV